MSGHKWFGQAFNEKKKYVKNQITKKLLIIIAEGDKLFFID